jgi:hypothetical protein
MLSGTKYLRIKLNEWRRKKTSSTGYKQFLHWMQGFMVAVIWLLWNHSVPHHKSDSICQNSWVRITPWIFAATKALSAVPWGVDRIQALTRLGNCTSRSQKWRHLNLLTFWKEWVWNQQALSRSLWPWHRYFQAQMAVTSDTALWFILMAF